MGSPYQLITHLTQNYLLGQDADRLSSTLPGNSCREDFSHSAANLGLTNWAITTAHDPRSTVCRDFLRAKTPIFVQVHLRHRWSIFVHLCALRASLEIAILQIFPWLKVDHRLTFQKEMEFTFLVSNDLNFNPHSGAKNPKIE